jgi:hypothetical protein
MNGQTATSPGPEFRCALQQTWLLDFRLGSQADMTRSNHDVRYSPESGLQTVVAECPLSAINVRFASRRTAAKFASLFDEAGGGDIVR